MFELRQVFWVLNSRTATRKTAKQCFHCRKMKGKAVLPYMNDQLTFWLEYQQLPFTNTAINYFDLIFIKQHQSRLKRWGCLFVCRVSHLGLTSREYFGENDQKLHENYKNNILGAKQ